MPVGMVLRARTTLVAGHRTPVGSDDGGFMGITARLKKVRPGVRVGAVVSGLAVFAAGAFFVAGGANADEQTTPRVFGYKSAGNLPRGQVVKGDVKNKLPNVRKATKTEYKLGKNGPAFGQKNTTRIVGGVPAATSDHPYIVGIRTIFFVDEGGPQYQGYVSTCTGTVISSTKILTAGHCSFDSPLGTTYVFAGRTNLDDTNTGYTALVRSTYTHQGFQYISASGGYVPNNDAAVLTLRDPLPSVYTPISLVAQGNEAAYADNAPAKIVGYGITAEGAEDDGILRETDVPIRSDSICAGALSGYQNTTMACAGIPASAGNPGKDTCNGDSGGPLIATTGGKTQVGITSWGPANCGESYGAYSQVSAFANLINADNGRKSPNNLDWTGDGHSDLMGRDGNGNLRLYSGTGFVNTTQFPGAFTEDVPQIGSGWGGFRKVFRVWNWNGDNKPSVFAIDGGGDLWQYKGTGNETGGLSGFQNTPRVRIGVGWQMYNDIMVTNDWTGNGRPNLLGRSPNGDLYLYTSDGNGGWQNGGVGQRIGIGWSMFNTVLTPGDWKGDGHQTLIGRTSNGDLFLYQSDGQGGWVNGGIGQKIGIGWNIFNIFMSPGDINGDNLVDMIGITPGGQLKLYESDGAGNWLTPSGIQIGTGWNAFNAVF
jgi:secreted trypsin-like serine protease